MREPQKKTTGRPIATVRTKITACCIAVVTVVGIACQSGDVDLGERGSADAPAGGSASGADGGAGVGGVAGSGGSGTGGAGGTTSGSGSNQAAGSGGVLAMPDAGGTVAMPQADAAVDDSQPSIGCGSEPPITDMSIDVAGMTGSFLVDLPSGYDNSRPYPLIMAFRGAGVSAEDFRGYLDLVPVVGADAIVVNVDCLDGAPTWSIGRDLPLFDALLLHLEMSYCVDELRVFAARARSAVCVVTSCARSRRSRVVRPRPRAKVSSQFG